jgi:hypothetical protein
MVPRLRIAARINLIRRAEGAVGSSGEAGDGALEETPGGGQTEVLTR